MEVWKDVPGFPGYQVSNIGKLRSFWRHGNWNEKLSQEPHPITLVPAEGGRLCAILKQGKAYKHIKIHALVLEAFVGPKPIGFIGCHKDDDRSNNTVENLYWGTHKENAEDAIRNERLLLGSDHRCAKMTEETVIKLYSEQLSGKTYVELGKQFGVCPQIAHKICTGKSWRHMYPNKLRMLAHGSYC